MSEIRNREAWLTDLMVGLMPLVRQRTGLSLPDGVIKLSCGFPSRGGTRAKNRTVGECHHVGTTGDRKFHQIFVHPQLIDPVEIGGVVVHEVLHAMLPSGVGHRKPFAKAAEQVGLEGKPTATTVSEELAERIKEHTAKLGEYPHESLDAGGKKQTTRLLKVMCPICGYVCRVTFKWLDEAGTPICPQCNVGMDEAGTGEQASCPLTAVEQTVQYAVKSTTESRLKATKAGLRPDAYDPRWLLQMVRKGSDIRWWVVDYGAPVDESGKAVLGPVTPRLTPAESRQDAVELLDALREGLLTYKEIEVDDNDPALDKGDPFYEDEHEETADYDDGTLTEEELVAYEAESAAREGRV